MATMLAQRRLLDCSVFLADRYMLASGRNLAWRLTRVASRCWLGLFLRTFCRNLWLRHLHTSRAIKHIGLEEIRQDLVQLFFRHGRSSFIEPNSPMLEPFRAKAMA